LLKRRHKHNREDKAFLLVELRIAIQRDSALLSCTHVYWSLHCFLIPCSYWPLLL
jgi:hypothetical protein